MCLTVYLGSDVSITPAQPGPVGGLGLEPASWIPPVLSGHRFVYSLGRIGDGRKLECSCLLLESVDWSGEGPWVFSDELYPDGVECPFETLRDLCRQAVSASGWATLVSDDSGGARLSCSATDYQEAGYLPLHLITRGSLLFSDMPWRRWRVIDVPMPLARHPLSGVSDS